MTELPVAPYLPMKPNSAKSNCCQETSICVQARIPKVKVWPSSPTGSSNRLVSCAFLRQSESNQTNSQWTSWRANTYWSHATAGSENHCFCLSFQSRPPSMWQVMDTRVLLTLFSYALPKCMQKSKTIHCPWNNSRHAWKIVSHG